MLQEGLITKVQLGAVLKTMATPPDVECERELGEMLVKDVGLTPETVAGYLDEQAKMQKEGLQPPLLANMVIENKVVGLLGLANKPGGFIENDANMASAFAELAAIPSPINGR